MLFNFQGASCTLEVSLVLRAQLLYLIHQEKSSLFVKKFQKNLYIIYNRKKSTKRISKTPPRLSRWRIQYRYITIKITKKQDERCKNVKAVKYKKRKTKPFHAAVHPFKNSRRKRRRIQTREG